jgi:hypothetical protein
MPPRFNSTRSTADSATSIDPVSPSGFTLAIDEPERLLQLRRSKAVSLKYGSQRAAIRDHLTRAGRNGTFYFFSGNAPSTFASPVGSSDQFA